MSEHVNPPGEDFDWVNVWAATPNPAPNIPAPQPAVTAKPPPPAATSIVAAPAARPAKDDKPTRVHSAAGLIPEPDLLDRDIADIERARETLAEPQPFTIDASKLRRSPLAALRNPDSVPILVGSVVGMTLLIVFGAAASLIAMR